MKNLTERKEWLALSKHHQEIAHQHMREWFSEDGERLSRFSLSAGNLFLDYSRNRITNETLPLLCELANALQLSAKIAALFSGELLNTSEKRPALHVALRDTKHVNRMVNGENIAPLILRSQQKLRDFVDHIHAQTWRGSTGKAIKHIVNIGIGGSFTGPMMSIAALKDFAMSPLTFHFISSVDHAHLQEVLDEIDAETTLFILSSKSFTTLETLTNAESVVMWMRNTLPTFKMSQHFIAITAAPEKAQAFGISEENIFPLWDWVGGRYSIWSAIGLPLMLMIGNAQFSAFLSGASEIDQHFQTAPFAENMPVILALLGVWYRNFFGATTHALIPYAHRLRFLIPYLQQTEMESNGKNIASDGKALNYATGPVLFGEEGVIGQHAYHQLLHQGQHLIPADLIIVKNSADDNTNIHQDILIASALSQAQALMQGKTFHEAHAELCLTHNELEAKTLAAHQIIPGNKPNNLLLLDKITPKNLGALLALYEHKIFVQGIIWGINSFDQWGVELGKKLLPDILKEVKNNRDKNFAALVAGACAPVSVKKT